MRSSEAVDATPTPRCVRRAFRMLLRCAGLAINCANASSTSLERPVGGTAPDRIQMFSALARARRPTTAATRSAGVCRSGLTWEKKRRRSMSSLWSRAMSARTESAASGVTRLRDRCRFVRSKKRCSIAFMAPPAYSAFSAAVDLTLAHSTISSMEAVTAVPTGEDHEDAHVREFRRAMRRGIPSLREAPRREDRDDDDARSGARSEQGQPRDEAPGAARADLDWRDRADGRGHSERPAHAQRLPVAR